MQKLILGRVLRWKPRASSSPTSRRAGSTSGPSPMCSSSWPRRARGRGDPADLGGSRRAARPVRPRRRDVSRPALGAPGPWRYRSAHARPDDGRRHAGARACALSRAPRTTLAVAGGTRCALAATLIAAAALIAVAGAPVLRGFAVMFTGALGSGFALNEMLTRATPLIFTGLAARSPSAPGCGTSAPRASSTWARSPRRCSGPARSPCPRRC
jgi:hypothetical protein